MVRSYRWDIISHWFRLALGASFLVGQASCSCGAGADPAAAPNLAGSVASDGSVHFATIPSGGTETFPIPVKESADTNETIVSASLIGSGASSFQIRSQFPLAIPNGQDVAVEVEFTPTAVGTVDAELVLDTAKMGTSQILLFGTASQP